jgi:transposase
MITSGRGWVAVAYEAGPTGFGLCRALRAAGIRCEVVAPSRPQRAAGDRVQTDAKDALLLARLRGWTRSPRYRSRPPGRKRPGTWSGRPGARPGQVLGDKAYSSPTIRAHLRQRGIKATIPEPADQAPQPGPTTRP